MLVRRVEVRKRHVDEVEATEVFCHRILRNRILLIVIIIKTIVGAALTSIIVKLT